MISYSQTRINEIDSQRLSLENTLPLLRRLTLDEFGEFMMSVPNSDLPYLSSLFPAMAHPDVQQEWTGSSGLVLLRQSVNFMNFVAVNYALFGKKETSNAQVLDFGCGWERLLRLLVYLDNPSTIHGCDAWNISLEHSRKCGVDKIASALRKSDSTPTTLPFADHTFDLVYAFSIFTHVSRTTAVACMRAIHRVLIPGGMAIITIRPEEFWSFHTKIPTQDRDHLKQNHAREEVASYPSGGKLFNAQGQEMNYGDASIPIDGLEMLFSGWRVERVGTTFTDAQQVFVVLTTIGEGQN